MSTNEFVADKSCWLAVVARSAEADDHFFYSVKTTGVYCRPSCAARLALRKNVAFHRTAEDAENAGFRPCKRCKPNQPSRAERHAASIATACRLIEQAEQAPSLATLAKAVSMSNFHFHRIFKSITGVTPKAYATAHRAKTLRNQLPHSPSVSAAIYDAGFASNSRFYASAEQTLGMKPSKFRAGGLDETIQMAIDKCTLGTILVAASQTGICAILLGDDPEILAKDLRTRFPHADLTEGDQTFKTWVAKTIEFVDAPQLGLDLPLDIRGTAFQQRVWRALADIPVGSTATYAEIAANIDAPKAARAIANACAANALAVAIPCHRVIRNDGTISGYRWSVERKRQLLKTESSRQ